MVIGYPEPRMIRTQILSDCGHCSSGPSAVVDQSNARMQFAHLAASAEHRLDQLRHAVTHLGSVDLSIDAARRFRKRIAAGRFDLAFAVSGLIGLGAALIVGTWRGVPAGTSTRPSWQAFKQGSGKVVGDRLVLITSAPTLRSSRSMGSSTLSCRCTGAMSLTCLDESSAGYSGFKPSPLS